jgi:hypothetical protein
MFYPFLHFVSYRSSDGIFFSFRHRVQTGSGAHPDSYQMSARGGLSAGIKLPGPEADHSPSSSAQVKNVWSYTSIPPYV